MSGRVLVLGSDDRAFLAVVRSLGRLGCEVHGGMGTGQGLPWVLASRYLTMVHYLPPPSGDAGRWTDALVDLLRRESFEWVLPIVDPAIVPIQTQPDRFAEFPQIHRLPERAFEVAFSKPRSTALARELGVPVPAERIVESPADLAAVADEMAPPYVVKPSSSFVVGNLGAKNCVRKARDARQLEEFTADALAHGPVTVQQNVRGDGVGIELLVADGEVLVSFQHRRVHQPLDGGGSTYRVSEQVRPALLDASALLMRALGHHGVAMVEFIENRRTGEFWFVEINARFWGSLPLAVAAGCDFPAWLYQLDRQGRRDFPRRYRVGLYCRNPSADLLWLKANAGADRGDPELATRPWPAVVAEVGHLLTGRERFDTFALDDPKPGLVNAKVMLRGALRSSAAYRGLRGGMDRLLGRRRRAAAQVLRAVREADEILVVCKGNICRSPLAAELLRRGLPGKRITQAGYYPVAGRPSPDLAVQVAAEFGVDLAPHRSMLLDAAAVASADAILIFDGEHEQVLARQFPASAGKAHLLGRANPAGEAVIADPYGGDATTFRQAYAAIAAAVAQLTASE